MTFFSMIFVVLMDINFYGNIVSVTAPQQLLFLFSFVNAMLQSHNHVYHV